MSWMDRLRRGRVETPAPNGSDTPPCPHVTLVPRWDSAPDMGSEEKASAWVCDVCGATFTPAEVQGLRASEGERVKSALQDG